MNIVVLCRRIKELPASTIPGHASELPTLTLTIGRFFGNLKLKQEN
jgi:hypothetical protein